MKPDFELFSSLRFDPRLLSSSANSAVSIKSEPSPLYMLAYHRDRILEAASHFGWTKAIDQLKGPEGLEKLVKTLEEEGITDSKTALRVKVLVSHDGKITVEKNQTPDVPLENLYPSRVPPPLSSIGPKVSALTGGALTLGENDSVTGDAKKGDAWDIIPDLSRTTPSPYTRNKTTSRDMYTYARERVGIMNMAEKREVLIVSNKDGEIMEGSLTSVFFWRNGEWTTPPVSSGGQAGTTRRWLLEKGLCVEEPVRVDSLSEGEECWISNGVRGMSWGKVKLL